MKQLFVITHDTYAQGLTPGTSDLDDLGSLAVGAWAMLDMTEGSATYNKVVSIAATSEAETPARFMLATMTAGGLKTTPIITKAQATCVTKAYVAPVARIVMIGNQTDGGTTYSYNLPSLSAGQVAGIIVTDTSKPMHELSRNRTYEYTLGYGDTEATITAALIAKVNADSLRIVNAAVTYTNGTDGFKVTGITAGKLFTVSPIGIFQNADIAITTNGALGHGTVAQIQAYEKEALSIEGKANGRYDELFTQASVVNTTKTYATYTIQYVVPTLRPHNTSNNWTAELVIAVDSGLSASGDGKTFEGLDNMNADF